MKSIKVYVTLFFLGVFLFSTYSVRASMHKENLPMEGEFDERDARSVDPTKPLQAFLEDNSVCIEFSRFVPELVISIKDSNNNVVYTKTCFGPDVEIISLAGFGPDSYMLELRTEGGGYMYGTFSYGY